MEAYVYKPLSAPLRVLLIIVGTIALLIGLVAIFVPGLPTTEFVLLAAACYVRSSESLYVWVTSRPYLRPYFVAAQRFKESREMPLSVKLTALAMSWLSFTLLALGLLPAPPWVKWLVLALAIACTVFMLTIKTARLKLN